MTLLRFNLFMKALALLITCAAASDYPIVGVDISCAPGIDEAKCVQMAGAAKNPLARRAVDCAKVTGVLSAVKALGAPATAFCSSYLRVPSATTVQTTITPAAVTNTMIETVIATVTVVQPTFFKRDLEDFTPYRAPVHDIEARAVPAGLLKYAAGEISSACKCLNIQPKTTVRATITAPTPPPVNTVITTNVITTITTCTASGGPCDCGRPDFCCGGGCSCNDAAGQPVSTCFL